MKYKVLIILFVLGCSTDLAPDDKFIFKLDISDDEVNVILRNVVDDLYFVLGEVVHFCLRNIILPALDFISFTVHNVDVYFQKNVYIWILFFRFDTIYKHTVYGVRSNNTFRKIFFVRSAGAAVCVLTMLLTASVFNISCLVTCVRVFQLPSLWTVLCSPWQLFAVKTLPPGTNTYLYSLLSRVDVYLELFYTVCSNQNIIHMLYVFGSLVQGKHWVGVQALLFSNVEALYLI